MKFEVVTDKGVVEMSCTSTKFVPNEKQLLSMSDAGYKFKINGKYVNRRKINEVLKSLGENTYDD